MTLKLPKSQQSKFMKNILFEEKVVAVYFDGVYGNGTVPLTDGNMPLQIIGLNHPKGKVLVAHSHSPKTRQTESLVECLVVFSGKVRATIYSSKTKVTEIDLIAGQALMIVDGGVGYEILEDATMMEFKNGPFLEDKIIF